MKKFILVLFIMFLSSCCTQQITTEKIVCDDVAITKYMNNCIKESGVTYKDSLNYKYYRAICEREAKAKYCKKETFITTKRSNKKNK